MDIYNETHTKLLDNEYIRTDNEELNLLGCDLYIKSDISVCIYKSLDIDNIKEVDILSVKVRKILNDKNLNVFNSYLLILIEEKIDYEIFYLIERNNIGIRKYVIKHKTDLERVTFLNFQEKINSSVSPNSIGEENSDFIKKTLEILDENNYSVYKFDEKKLVQISELIIGKVKNNNEDN